MAKRRSSLRGRGSEILFGEPAPVDIEPRGPVTVLDETVPLEPDALEPVPIDDPLVDLMDEPPTFSPAETIPSLEEELEKALYEEARDGELAPGEKEIYPS